ncbi:hypothetical protein HDIA_1128 [Hartmannibacter diazotrophicus]|uniref:Uncharacterized protein n=1 Tax=Hartmannibacter diazotrophicus TaxID=1482074 RepID=A0A2C9D3A5_9HYPH|nr:hypothetical protein HDIA_1128 [Hartmannibacter diazotrophicus]
MGGFDGKRPGNGAKRHANVSIRAAFVSRLKRRQAVNQAIRRTVLMEDGDRIAP